MKVNLIIGQVCISMLLLPSALSQSFFALDNKEFALVDAPVFDAKGTPLSGTNYLAELWGAATPNALTP